MPRLTKDVRTGTEPTEGGSLLPPDRSNKVDPETQLAEYGITPVPVMFFDWSGYRYSNARDAVAAAKRGARS